MPVTFVTSQILVLESKNEKSILLLSCTVAKHIAPRKHNTNLMEFKVEFSDINGMVLASAWPINDEPVEKSIS